MTTRPTDEEIRIELENGKYTIIQHKDGRIEALRYGEAWRDLTGDKLFAALIDERQAARVGVTDGRVRCLSDKDKRTLRELSEQYKSEGWGSPDHQEWDRLTHPYSIDLLLTEIDGLRAALQSVAQPVRELSSVSLAVIGKKHFGNPIPKEWYAAAKELLARSPRPQQAVPDMKLDKPARVGGATFGIGVTWSTVIGCAQRAYEAKPISEETAKEMRALISTFNYPPEHNGDKPEPWNSAAPGVQRQEGG